MASESDLPSPFPGVTDGGASALLASLLAQSIDAVVLTDANLNVTEYGRSAERLYGWSRADVLGRQWFTTIPTTITSAAIDDVMQLIRDEQTVRVEARFQRQSGDWVDAEISATPIRDGNGQLTGWLGIGRDITARVAQSRALAATTARLNDVLLGSNDGIWESWPATGELTLNARWAEMLGYDLAEIEPTIATWERLVHPADLGWAWAAVRSHLEGKASAYRIEYRMRHKDGHWVWVLTRGRVVERNDAGRPVRMAGTQTEITERKGLESTLRDREARLRAFFDTPAVGIIVSTAHAAIVEVNECACDILGYGRDELQATTWTALTYPDDLDADAAQYAKLLAGEIDHYSLDKRYIRKDGRVVWCLLSVSCVRPPDGGIRYAVAIIKDITERKAVEELLRESEAKFRAVVEATSDGVSLLDLRDGSFAVLNPRQVGETGFTEDEVRSLPIAEGIERVHPDDRPLLEEQALRTIRGEEPGPVDYRWRVKNGQYRWYSGLRSLVRDEAGHPVALVAVSRDITGRKLAEEAIRQELAENVTVVESLRERLTQRTLGDFLPTCMTCRKIRNEVGQWEQIESYITHHTGSLFSHGLCPDCSAKFLDEVDSEDRSS